jgi:hypothetical protein
MLNINPGTNNSGNKTAGEPEMKNQNKNENDLMAYVVLYHYHPTDECDFYIGEDLEDEISGVFTDEKSAVLGMHLPSEEELKIMISCIKYNITTL